MASNTITFHYRGESSQFQRESEKAAKALERVGFVADKSSKQASGGFSKLKAAFVGLGVEEFARRSANAFLEEQVSTAKLQNTLKNNPQLAHASEKGFEDLARSISYKTAADRESITSGIAVLGQFKLNESQLRDLTPLVVDYARKTGQDVPSAATAIGRALLGNTRALKAIGINFKATGNAGKDYATILGLLQSKVGGYAATEEKSRHNIDVMQHRFHDLQVEVGGKLLSAFDFLVRNFNTLLPLIVAVGAAIATVKITKFAKDLASAVSAVASWIASLSAQAAATGAAAVANEALAVSAGAQTAAIGAATVANQALVASDAEVVGAEQIMGAVALKSALALQAQATAATEAAAAEATAAAAMPALLAGATALLGGLIAVAASFKAVRQGMAEVSAANKATSASFLNDTIPALLKTGGALKITAEQWRSGPFGGSDLNKVKAVFDLLSKGAISTTQAFQSLKSIAGVTQTQIDAVVQAQIASALAADKQKGSYADVATAVVTAFRAAGTSAATLGESLRGLSDKALEKVFTDLEKAGLSADDLSRIFNAARPNVGAVSHALTTAGAAAALARTKILGMTQVDFKTWANSLTGSLNFVSGSLQTLGGNAKLSAKDVLKAFSDELKAMTQYRQNFDTLLARHAPADLLKQLADMGQQGATLVAALAHANTTQFNAIVARWNTARRASRGVASDIESMAARARKAIASIQNRTVNIAVAIRTTEGKIIGGGAVRRELVGFAEGGFIAGPKGAAQAIIAHGGEFVLTQKEVAQAKAGKLDFLNKLGPFNVNVAAPKLTAALSPARASVLSSRLQAASVNTTSTSHHYDDHSTVVVNNPVPEKLSETLPALRRRKQILAGH